MKETLKDIKSKKVVDLGAYRKAKQKVDREKLSEKFVEYAKKNPWEDNKEPNNPNAPKK